jgi:integral membrane sensor domain MASE1
VPLLIAYKLKFITMVPVLVAAVVLLAASTGLAGFFFALFASAITNKD